MNNKNLIIVESPNKIKTIQSYVGDDYEVIATYGHLRELNKTKGYDYNTFEPYWQVVGSKTRNSKEPIIKEIKKHAKKANQIYLATDPDREGEAISWHVWDILTEEERAKCRRITFNEVTKTAILNAIENYREIDMDLVNSQFARRILDRLIGYKLSALVKKTQHAISAGRVQSVALMFVVNRQLERLQFVPSKWLEITATLENGVDLIFTGKNCTAKPYEDSETNTFRFALKEDAEKVFNKLTDNFVLTKIDDPKKTKGDAQKPITTDKLLQMASTNLGWSATKTTSVAQKMFEGVEINGNQIGLISYPRTDSERLSLDFTNATKEFILDKFGEAYYNKDFVVSKVSKNKEKQLNVQDAHEAIRPVDVNITPESIKDSVTPQIFKLYNLIWTRTVSSMMNVPLFNKHNLYFENEHEEFFASYKDIAFDGYYVLDYYAKTVKQYKQKFPNMEVGKVYKGKAELIEKEKQPPAYFTEASLIAALKESGVGRPSTYATMTKIGEERGYVYKDSQKLIPTDVGMNVIGELKKDFPQIMTPEFTVDMENELDKIANGEDSWNGYLESFAPNFESQLKEVYANLPKVELEKVGRMCPNDGSELVYRTSKYGTKFIACSAFPKCKYTESIPDANKTGESCPECGSELIIRINKKKKPFTGCSNYPDCKYIKSNSKSKKTNLE
ncbi:type I DNA topoisomerase [Ureaplasma ceti]|uniref:DNA topoisomerase 1 n=1 Tax=Ureaplasma ceti TaxID=3119530 RepID=A0ABP9U9Z0_9BACT